MDAYSNADSNAHNYNDTLINENFYYNDNGYSDGDYDKYHFAYTVYYTDGDS